MSRYGLLTTYSSTICSDDGERFNCASFGDANRLRLSIQKTCDAYEARITELEGKLKEYRTRALDAEHRIEHPPLAENQDELARICYEAYKAYAEPDSDNTWEEFDAWDSYGWRLAANAVRVSCEADLARVKAESLRVVKVGEPCDVGFLCAGAGADYEGKFLHNGVVLERFGAYSSEYDGQDVSVLDMLGNDSTLTPDTIVQPVELKTWEATE